MKICMWTIYANEHQTVFYEALRRRGADVVVCYFSRHDAYRVAQGWRERGLLPYEYRAASPRQAKALIADFDERLQVCTGFYSAAYWRLVFYCLAHRLPWVSFTEASTGRWRSWPLRRVYGWIVARFALKAFGVGHLGCRDLRAWGVPQHKIALLTHSTPERRPAVLPDEEIRSFCAGSVGFIYAGTFSRRKATDVLLKAFDKVYVRCPSVRLVLVGNDATGGRIPELARRLACRQAVLLRGVMPPEVIDAALSAADVCVLPSRFDGWGMVLAEGARNGLALIGSDRCGASEHLIQPGRNGVIVPADDVPALTEAMRRYAETPGLSRKEGVWSQERMHPLYAAEANAERFLQGIGPTGGTS